MAEDNARPGERENTAFGIALTAAERTGKAIAVFTATSYVIGYAVTAARLAQGGVATTRLIDAQYFAAGFLPGLLVWLTVLVVLSAYHYEPRQEDRRLRSSLVVLSACHYEPRQEDRRLKSSWWYVVLSLFILFFTAIIIEVLNGIARERWSDFAQSMLSISVNLIKLILGELALWYLVAGLTSKVLWELIKDLRKIGEGYAPALAFCLLPLVLVVIGMSQIVPTTWLAYTAIPQSYGGGKPHRVQLYVDRKKVPAELLDVTPSAQHPSAGYTVPLNLIFQTPTEYIVHPVEDGKRRAWVLKANVVYAVVEKPEK